jgi:hypothetical protein
MFTIDKDKTPILFRQSQQIQKFATDFVSLYRGKKSVKERCDWGELLDSIYKALPTTQWPSEPKQPTLSRNELWIEVCAELDIPRSTADAYRGEFIATSKYPDSIRAAAAQVGLNLAPEYIQEAYADMKDKPASPNPLEASGIVSLLEAVDNPDKKGGKTPKKTLKSKLIDLFSEIYELTEAKKLAKEKLVMLVPEGEGTKEETIPPALFIRRCMEEAAGDMSRNDLTLWQDVVSSMARDEFEPLADHLIETKEKVVGA